MFERWRPHCRWRHNFPGASPSCPLTFILSDSMTFFLRLLPCRPTDACQGHRRYRRLFPLVPGRQPRAGQSRGAAGCMSSPPPDVAPPKPPDDFPIGTMRRDAGTSGHRDNTIVLSRLSRLSRHRNPAENCGLAVKNSVSTRHTVNRTCLGRLV